MAASRCSGDALLSEPMRRRRGLQSQPRAYLAYGERWPRGRLRALTDEEKRNDKANDVLAVVHFVKSLAIRVEEKCRKETIYKVALDANVNAQTVANFLVGETWGDVVVIFRLERGMKEALWSHDHVSPSLQRKRRPCDYLIEGHQWPGGTLKKEAPHAVHFVQQLAAKLREICNEESLQAVAESADVTKEAIIDFLTGKTWGDVEFIFRLEHGLAKGLWSHDHLSPRWTNKISDSERA